MCSIIGVGERLHKILGQIDLAHWTQVSNRCPLGYLFVCTGKMHYTKYGFWHSVSRGPWAAMEHSRQLDFADFPSTSLSP